MQQMKRLLQLILFLLLHITFFQCEKDRSPLELEDIKFFNPCNLPQLSLDYVGEFWGNDSIKSISDYVTAHFNRHPKHLASIRYSSEKGNVIAVSVFKTQASAIAAMEERLSDVAALIFAGNSQGEEFEKYRDQFWAQGMQYKTKDKWWWSIAPQRFIFINKWNTIIQVGNLYGDLSDSTRLLLEDTAIEIAERVDALSHPL